MIIHIVEQGETVFSIANEYGVSTQRIIADNGLYGLNNLVPRQALLILQPDKTYTAKTGDTLTSISRDTGLSIEELKQKNPSLAQTDTITPGEIIATSFKFETSEPITIYGFLYPNIKENVLKSSLPSLGYGAIFSYGADENGTLITTDDTKVINMLISGNAAPIMVLSSITESGTFDSNLASELFNNINKQDRVINQVLQTIKKKNYRGLDIDFEFVNADDRDAFTNFVRRTTERLNAEGYTVNVDLAPKTSSQQKGTLYEGHNYKSLGEAANTVLVMTYEWGYTYSEPMAVAPINQVRQVLEYAVSEISRDKIYMGIPNYGYDWKLPYEKGVTRARLVGNEEAISIAAENNATIMFDEVSKTPYFNYKAADGTDHEVWFEDIRSIEAKFNLRDEFGLKGVGYWNLMRSFNQNWSYIGYRYSPFKTII